LEVMISADDPLQAYIDGSGTGSPSGLVLAGYVARASEWARFSQAWREKLAEAGLPRFKMHEMVTEKQRDIAAYFYRTIEEYNIEAAVRL